MENADVVVVGAGIAGLSVARGLISQGLVVAVLEARSRVGGRLHSHRSPAGTFDLGATWFWSGEKRVASLIDEFSIPTHPQYLAGDAMYEDANGVQRIDGNPIDAPASRFDGGAARLAEELASRLPAGTVSLDTPVSAISATAAGLGIDHRSGSIEAAHCALAVPPALVATAIGFKPALPDRMAGLAAVTPVWMGSIAKVVAVYDKPFWRAQGLAGSAISHVGPMREIHDMSGPEGAPAALFGFVPLSDEVPAPTKTALRDQLVAIFGAEAAEPIEFAIMDWRSESMTSPPGVGALGAYQAFGHELYQQPCFEGRLHWASTETSIVAPGHIEGALAAAERVVAAIERVATR